jgi:hypothetical protein
VSGAAAVTQGMHHLPLLDEGLGPIDDMRSFTLDHIHWRAFEVQSRISPDRPPLLIVFNEDARYERQIFPPNWRVLSPYALIAAVCNPRALAQAAAAAAS